MAEIRKFLDPSGLSLLWDKVKDELDKKADETSLPTKVSELQNDAGYLTQETDPTVPSWAKAQVKPSYTAQEVGALPDNTFIPSNVSDLTNDTGFITSAALPTNVSDLTNDAGYLTQETDPTVPAWAKAVNKPSYTAQEVGALSSNTFIPSKVSDLVDDSGHYTKPVTGIPATDLEETYLTQHQDISGKANSADLATVATSGSYNDLSNKPTIPSKISDLTDDSGHYIKPVTGIPASDLEETYLTSFTETDPTVPNWAKAAQKPTYTASEVGAPTVSEMNTAISNAIGNVHQFGIEVVQELPTIGIKEHTVYFVPKTGETNDVYDEYIRVNNAWEMIGNTQIDLSNYATKSEIPNVPVTDVQVNETSILNNGVANIPKAGKTELGVAKVGLNGSYGLDVLSDGTIIVYPASVANIQSGATAYRPIVPASQHQAAFYGLAKLVGADMNSSSNPVGTYTDAAKQGIQKLFGFENIFGTYQDNLIAVKNYAVGETFIMDGKRYKVTQAMSENAAITVGTNCELCPLDGDVYKKSDLIFNGNDYGVSVTSGTKLVYIVNASESQIKNGSGSYRPVVPGIQHKSVFYGLAKAAGDTTQSQSDNAVGTYTSEAKAAILAMIGAKDEAYAPDLSNYVQFNDYASSSKAGVIKIPEGLGIYINPSTGEMMISSASSANIKEGTNVYRPVSPAKQHESVFYGLAKAAGIDLKNEIVTVGTYPLTAATAIKTMLQVQEGLEVVKLI